jgi:hypothetical protein
MRRDLFVTKATSTLKKEIAEQRDVVVKGDGSFTIRAVGGRRNQRLLLWQPHDADVEKAANDSAKDKNKQSEKRRRKERQTLYPLSHLS